MTARAENLLHGAIQPHQLVAASVLQLGKPRGIGFVVQLDLAGGKARNALIHQAAEHSRQLVGALLIGGVQGMRGNDLLADGMDAFVLLENVRVNGLSTLAMKSPG